MMLRTGTTTAKRFQARRRSGSPQTSRKTRPTRCLVVRVEGSSVRPDAEYARPQRTVPKPQTGCVHNSAYSSSSSGRPAMIVEHGSTSRVALRYVAGWMMGRGIAGNCFIGKSRET